MEQSSRLRFIPACAGNSTASTRTVLMSAVHPRLRGELFPHLFTGVKLTGSSPLARGTLSVDGSLEGYVRFIPACAGNSSGASIVWSSPIGSSPLARGTPRFHLRRKPRNRFIPACAGNSNSAKQQKELMAVHPRLRGELLLLVTYLLNAGRFIPACAGNSKFEISPSRKIAVHPRLRGELHRSRTEVTTADGSSPLARGTQYPSGRRPQTVRFIPACAGNSKKPPSRMYRETVHPRLRGELR